LIRLLYQSLKKLKIDDIITSLKNNNIQEAYDVRKFPTGQFHISPNTLNERLNAINIRYTYIYGLSLHVSRHPKNKWYNKIMKQKYLIKLSKSEMYKRLLTILKGRDIIVALLCYCNHEQCHAIWLKEQLEKDLNEIDTVRI